MQKRWIKRATWGFVVAAGLAALAWLGWPPPIAVDLGAVTRGPMQVTVDDEGKSQVRHIYTVSAPTAGEVLRISHPAGEPGTSLHMGDPVIANETVIAVMRPTTPGFIDLRSREESAAAVAAAEAAVKYANSEVQRLEAAMAFYRGELSRTQALARTQTVSVQALDKAQFDFDSNQAALASAKALVDVWQSVRRSLAARLMGPSDATGPADPNCCVQIRSPVTGRVLKILQESEAVVPAGAPLMEIGDPRDLEVVADLLSTDAVQVHVGSQVTIDGWGGPPVRGRVTRVDPAGFTKVSALGIEEQRVHTTIDFVDPAQAWSGLGHNYHVNVHITIWNAKDVLMVPVGALFRLKGSWAVFAIKGGRARVIPVEIGHRNDQTAEVLSGLSEGDRVVLHPSDRVTDGARIAERWIS